MKKLFTSVALAVLLALAGSANAALTIVVPAVQLQGNTDNQPVQLSVSGGDLISAVNVKAVLGNGSAAGAEPIFKSFDFTTGTIFSDTANHPGTKSGGPVAGIPQDAQVNYALNTQNDTVAANGIFVTAFISTVGLNSGTYAFSLKNTEIGSDTNFVLPGGASDNPTITNGSITIPEPSSLMGLVFGSLLFVRRRRS